MWSPTCAETASPAGAHLHDQLSVPKMSAWAVMVTIEMVTGAAPTTAVLPRHCAAELIREPETAPTRVLTVVSVVRVSVAVPEPSGVLTEIGAVSAR